MLSAKATGTTSPVDPPVEKLEITVNAVYDEESGNITITWESNNPDGTFDILMSVDGENFVSIGTVEGVSEFVYTPESDFETLYFKVVQAVGEQTAESNIVAVASNAEAIVIIAEALYDEEKYNTIIIKWISNVPDGNFEIFMSEDEENFISVGEIKNASEYAYTYEDDFNILYFKVRQTVGIRTTESNITKIIFFIDWESLLDTDDDGLSDVYEKYYYYTDPENPDTDGDGLPDGYEVYTLDTDPTKYDSDDNGVSDADEDFDNDGLSNLEEYQLGTNPLINDTDYDGLSDYDEVKIYETNPTEYDTDGDMISDGDEIALGLNPKSSATNGTPDNERTFEQTIDSDSLTLYLVNTKNNPYEVSIDITAAGIAKNNFKAKISGYNTIMKNDAILGAAPAFSYTDGLKIDDVTINFDLDSSITANSNGKYISISDEFIGIKRFNVFRYIEGTNMLLPIETFHDVENNRVYTHTNELGTYCLVDMEVWLDSLGIKPEASQARFSTLDLNNAAAIKAEKGDNLDVIFVVYSNSAFLNYMKSELIAVSDDIFKEATKQNISARIYFVTWMGSAYLNTNTGTYYADNIDDATSMINRFIAVNTASLTPTDYMLTKAINGINGDLQNYLQENSKQYCFIVDAGCNPACTTTHYGIDELKGKGMDFSFVYAPGNQNITNYASLSSNNSIYQMVAGDGRLAFSEFVFDHVLDRIEDEEDVYYIISSTGLTELPSDFGDILIDSVQDYDNDGLLDVQEINFDALDSNGNRLVTINPDGSIELPSFNKCIEVGGTYIESGLERFYLEADESILSQLDKIKVLPIISDPTSEDGDGDGILDLTEYEIMQKVRAGVSQFSTRNSNVVNTTGSSDAKMNPAECNTIVDLFEFDSTLDFLKFNETNGELLNYEFYTLAYSKNIFEDDNKLKDGINYGVLGTEKDAFYLEAYSIIDENNKVINELRINLNVKFNGNLSSGIFLVEKDETTDKIIKTNEIITQSDIINAIKNKWSNFGDPFKGTAYDFYDGMEIDVSVRVNIIEKNKDSFIIKIDNDNKDEKQIDTCNYTDLTLVEYNENSLTSKGNPNTIIKLDANPVLKLYTVRHVVNSAVYNNKPQSKDDILATCVHEFGHVMGITDAYGSRNKQSFFIEPISLPKYMDDENSIKSELYYNESYYNTPEAGDMMHFNGEVSANDIEMLIYARQESKPQYFVPIGRTCKEVKDADGNITYETKDIYPLSKAIRADYIYNATQTIDLKRKYGTVICSVNENEKYSYDDKDRYDNTYGKYVKYPNVL